MPPEPPEPPVVAPTPEPGTSHVRAEREMRRQLARTTGESEEEDKEDQARKAGLKQIPLASSGLTVEEKDNHVTVEIESFRRAYDLDIKVPAGSSLKLESAAMGGVRVEGVAARSRSKT